MKLKYLFENNPIHFINEDNMFVGSQPLNKQKVSFDVAYSRPVGTFNGLEIWGSKYFGKNKDLYGILDNQRKVLAWAVFDNKLNPNYSTFERAWVEPSERGKDHTLTIINFLITKANEKVMIDKNEITSTDSRNLIRKWMSYPPQKRHFNVSFFDSKGKIPSPDLDNILKDNTKNDVYIIFENTLNRELPRYGAGERILQDIIWY